MEREEDMASEGEEEDATGSSRAAGRGTGLWGGEGKYWIV